MKAVYLIPIFLLVVSLVFPVASVILNLSFLAEIIAFGGLGGCLSHQFGNLNALYSRHKRRVPSFPSSTRFLREEIVLVGIDNLAVLVHGRCHIRYDATPIHVDSPNHCSLIPLSGATTNVTTAGLKWNLGILVIRYSFFRHSHREFGRLCSLAMSSAPQTKWTPMR